MFRSKKVKKDYDKAIIEKIEKELNKYPESPFILHDMSVANLQFIDKKLYIRFLMLKWIDTENMFGGLEIKEDDNIVLDVVYDGIKIKDIQCGGKIDFKGITVSDFSKENGVMNILLYDYVDMFNCKYAFQSYKWSFRGIVPQKELNGYLKKSCNDICEEE